MLNQIIAEWVVRGNPFGPQPEPPSNPTGQLLIIAVLALPVLVIIGIIILRRPASEGEPQDRSLATSKRLADLEHLKDQKLISEAEYTEQRRKIISGV